MVNRKLVWDDIAKIQLQELYNYIYQESPKSALKVRNEIIKLLKKAVGKPEHFALDKYAKNQDGNFRAFEKYSYRISFYLTDNEIIVLRIRHTKMNPLEY